jgi:hypothetical protein
VTAPRLASWNKAGDPEQDRLGFYLVHVQEVAAPYMAGDAQLALELVVGMDQRKLTHDSDLDNFLEPVVRRLGAARFSAVFGSKQRQGHSTISVGPTTPSLEPRPPDLVVAPVGSYEQGNWVPQIEAPLRRVGGLDPDGVGPVRLVVAYDLGPTRTWVNLWKTTIDSLGPLLGTVPRPAKDHDDPRDGRIVDLALHQTVHPHAGNDVRISFWWEFGEASTTG